MQLPEVPAYQLAFATLLCAVLTDGKWMQVAERQRLPSGNSTVSWCSYVNSPFLDVFDRQIIELNGPTS